MRGPRALAWLACLLGACAGQHMTKPSPRAAKQDAVDAARDVSSGKLAELDTHKGGESAGGNAIGALRHAAFDDKGLSGSTARNAAAEMIKSKLATQTTRRRLECVNDDSTTDIGGVDAGRGPGGLVCSY